MSCEISLKIVEEVKEYRSILIELLLIMMRICLINIWNEDSIAEENQHCFRAAVMDMAIIPMIAGSSFKTKEFNSC
jgi:elongation factor G